MFFKWFIQIRPSRPTHSYSRAINIRVNAKFESMQGRFNTEGRDTTTPSRLIVTHTFESGSAVKSYSEEIISCSVSLLFSSVRSHPVESNMTKLKTSSLIKGFICLPDFCCSVGNYFLIYRLWPASVLYLNSRLSVGFRSRNRACPSNSISGGCMTKTITKNETKKQRNVLWTLPVGTRQHVSEFLVMKECCAS